MFLVVALKLKLPAQVFPLTSRDDTLDAQTHSQMGWPFTPTTGSSPQAPILMNSATCHSITQARNPGTMSTPSFSIPDHNPLSDASYRPCQPDISQTRLLSTSFSEPQSALLSPQSLQSFPHATLRAVFPTPSVRNLESLAFPRQPCMCQPHWPHSGHSLHTRTSATCPPCLHHVPWLIPSYTWDNLTGVLSLTCLE